MKRIEFGFLSVLFLRVLAGAQESTSPAAKFVMPLSREGGTARAMAMGSAVVGVPQGSASLFWNPAGLGRCEPGVELGLHHNSGLGDSTHETAVVGKQLGRLGGFAASVNYVNNGTFEGRDSLGNQTDDYGAGDLGASLGWGRQWLAGISGGVAVKYNRQTLGNESYSATAMDLGLLWNPFSRFNAGLTRFNLGAKVAGHALDSGWRGGASYRARKNLLLAASSELKSERFDRVQVGVEGLMNPTLALRAGYVQYLNDSSLAGVAGVTAGFGIKIAEALMLDYAYIPLGELEASHRFSLTYK